jgi:site-specific recombinase XerD
MAFKAAKRTPPTIVDSSVGRMQEYFTPAEIERLMATARRSSRYGHRDATMILMAYRHGLRASLCDLQWHQVELTRGRYTFTGPSGGRPVCIQCRAMAFVTASNVCSSR